MKNTLDLVRVLGEVARIANESDVTRGAVQRTLRHLLENGDWDVAHLYLVDDEGGHLRGTDLWVGLDASPASGRLRDISRALRVERGRGWVGRIQAHARPLWMEDIATESDFPRAGPALAVGLRTALGFPVLMDSKVVGVVELFSRTPRPSEPKITELAVQLGEILGSVHRREASRTELDAALRRFEALFSLLPLPAVVASLPDGVYVEVNRRFEETFGFSRDEILGRTDVDLGLWPDTLERRRMLTKIPMAPDYVASRVTLVGRDGRPIQGLATVTRISWDGVPHLLGMMLDISERVEAERQLQERREQVDSLVERLLTLQEEERSRIARELHDRIGQTLTAIKLKVAELEHVEPGSRGRVAHEVREMLDETLEGARTLSFELRPAMLDELGLSNAVRAYSVRRAGAAGLNVNLVVADVLPDVPGEVQTACYRILQEAVTNAIRHAGASTLTVRLDGYVGDLVLGVEDDGRGFRTERGGVHLGLLIMRERAELAGGAVQISSSPGAGTVVTARFPTAEDARP